MRWLAERGVLLPDGTQRVLLIAATAVWNKASHMSSTADGPASLVSL